MIYYETLGDGGLPILFVHGASQSLKSWKALMQQSVLKNNRLIAIDLPGHGNSAYSQKPEEDYSIKVIGNNLKIFIEEKIKEDFIIVGTSIGTNIIAESIPLKNCKGLFFIGANILGKGIGIENILKPNENIGLGFQSSLSEKEIEIYLADVVDNNDEEILELLKNDFLSTDPLFRTTLAKAIHLMDFSDEVEKINETKIPIALLYGKNEKIVNSNYLATYIKNLWRGKIHEINDAGHCAHIDQPSEVAEILNQFSKDCMNL